MNDHDQATQRVTLVAWCVSFRWRDSKRVIRQSISIHGKNDFLIFKTQAKAKKWIDAEYGAFARSRDFLMPIPVRVTINIQEGQRVA